MGGHFYSEYLQKIL